MRTKEQNEGFFHETNSSTISSLNGVWFKKHMYCLQQSNMFNYGEGNIDILHKHIYIQITLSVWYQLCYVTQLIPYHT